MHFIGNLFFFLAVKKIENWLRFDDYRHVESGSL